MTTPAGLQALHNKITNCKTPEELFGVSCTRDSINVNYRVMVQEVHPDHFKGDYDIRLATDAFKHLTSLRDEAYKRFDAGIYGKKEPTVKPRYPVVVTVNKVKYVVEEEIAKGDIATLYKCYKQGSPNYVFKIANLPSDNDLLINESKRLKLLNPKDSTDPHTRYFHHVVDSFLLKSNKVSRQVNVLTYHPEHATLEAVNKRYSHGIDFRDAMWMLRRLLEVLGYVHSKGMVHGAIIPPHVMVHPTDHGAKLVGWGCSVDVGSPIKAISAAWKDHYPMEVFKNNPVTPATDVYMASRLALWLIDDRIPTALKNFLQANLMVAKHRHQHAWDMYDDLSKLLEKLVGKPVYRKLEI